MKESVRKTALNNGLTIILKEMHHAPVACVMVWYCVGSRNERPGITGISHWVEHQLFSGSEKFPKGECDRLISRVGGYWNAFTWIDHTTFFHTMPADQIKLALEIESDRMVNVNIDDESFERERSIILSERAMYENEPGFLLNEALNAIAFQVHPYRHDVIGDEVDLKSIKRSQLTNYYQQHYAPNNAVVVVTGDFDSPEMLSLIDSYFGSIPRSSLDLEPVRQEPEQRGERRVIVQGPGSTAYLEVAYRAPSANHTDYLALVLINAIFTGGSSLGTFIGVGGNRSSWLYKALVESDLAVSAIGSLFPTIDPFLYSFSIVLREGKPLEKVEKVFDDEIERFKQSTITHLEMQKALKRAKAQFVMAGESITGQAQLLGLTEIATGDFSWYESVLQRLEKITIDDLNRVRDLYLQKKFRCVGWYQPED